MGARHLTAAGTSKADTRGLPPKLLISVVVITGLALSFGLFLKLRGSERVLFEVEFRQRARERAAASEKEFASAILLVETLATFLSFSGQFDRELFRQHCDALLDRHTSLHALSYNALIKVDERAAFEAASRAEIGADFGIMELRSDGRLVPAARRDEYVVVQLIEPLDTNRVALGLDVASEPVRREAFWKARRTGRPMVTGRIDLVQESGGKFGLLMAAPVFRWDRGADVAPPNEAESPDGFAVAVFDISETFEAAIRRLEPVGIDIRLVDESAARDPLLHLHRSRTRAQEGEVVFDLPDFPMEEYRFEFAGRRWALDSQPTPAYLGRSRGGAPLNMLGVGLALTFLLAWYLYNQARLNAQFRRSVRQERNALEALRLSDQRFRELVDDVDGIVWEAELPSSRFTFVSKHAEDLLGHSVEAWRQPDFWISQIHPDDRANAAAHHRRCIEQDVDHDFEYRARTADGATVWIENVVHVVRDADGRPNKLRGLMIDITQRKRLEAEQAALARRSTQAQKLEALGTLAAGVAHDFNNALMSISGYLDLLRDRARGDASAMQAVEAVQATAEQTTGVTKALLTFGQETVSEKTPRQLSKVLEQTIPMISSMMPATVQLIFKPEVPADLWVEMDTPQIQQTTLMGTEEALGPVPFI